MLFNSFSYAIFLPIVFCFYWMLSEKYRWVILLGSSYYFYMSWNVKYVILIYVTTLISYTCAVLIEKYKCGKKQLILFSTVLVVSLGVLFFFKYFNFFMDTINKCFQGVSIPIHFMTLKLLLPVGISFYTFQTLSYVIDVYRGTIKAEHHFGKYAAFISFFPQLVAGPIERTQNLLPEIKKMHFFKYKEAAYGLKLMTWGFFKKLVIADNLSGYVDIAYRGGVFKGGSLVIATIFFSFQIYCDFSGYSDIAIGTAQLFDINLTKNFNSPYFASSIKEFWGKWHISLSTWFRDYVYIPLGGNRCGKLRHWLNLMITFLVSGLWHGAAWSYVVWGGIHGAAQIAEDIFKKGKPSPKGIHRYLSIIMVFIFCNFAWIFFRAPSIFDAIIILKDMFYGINQPVSYLKQGFIDLGIGKEALAKICIPLCLLMAFDWYSRKQDIISIISGWKLVFRWTLYYAFLILIILWGNFGNSQFVYFQF